MGGQDGLDVGGHQELTTHRGHDVYIYALRAATRTLLAARLRGSEQGQKQKAGLPSPASTSASGQTFWAPSARYRGAGEGAGWGCEGGMRKHLAKLDRHLDA